MLVGYADTIQDRGKYAKNKTDTNSNLNYHVFVLKCTQSPSTRLPVERGGDDYF